MKTISNKILIEYNESEMNQLSNGLYKADSEGSKYVNRPNWGIVAFEPHGIPELSKGDKVWFHHFVTDDPMLINGISYYQADLGQIFAKGELEDLRPFGKVIAEQIEEPPQKTESGILLEARGKQKERHAKIKFSSIEGLDKGSVINYRNNADYGITFDLEEYYFIDPRHIFEVDGNLYGDKVKIKPLDEDDEWEEKNGIYLKSKDRAPKRLGEVIATNTTELEVGDKVYYRKDENERLGDYQYPNEINVYLKLVTDSTKALAL